MNWFWLRLFIFTLHILIFNPFVLISIILNGITTHMSQFFVGDELKLVFDACWLFQLINQIKVLIVIDWDFKF